MKTKLFKQQILSVALAALLAAGGAGAVAAQGQVLAKVADYTITSDDLDRAVRSSPFATQFNTMDEKDQAALRGGLLKRLVAARLFTLEARRLGIDQQPEFRHEVEEYRLGLLYRTYLEGIRARIELPAEVQAEMKEQYKGEPDALAAARSVRLAEDYKAMREVGLAHLAKKHHLVSYEERIVPGMAADVVLAEGDGFQVTAGELKYGAEDSVATIREALKSRIELELAAKGAADAGGDVSAAVAAFEEERLAAKIMEARRTDWIGDEKAQRAYFDAHPELSLIPERRHVGQLVVATQEEAEALKKRIDAGESLFKLAGEHSIDPYGRAQNGDMGWLRAGTGMPEIEVVLRTIKDGAVSDVIKTAMGYHLVTVMERRLGKQMYFEAVRDRVEREMMAERFTPYLRELEGRYPVAWEVLQQ